MNKSSHGYRFMKFDHDEFVVVFFFVGKLDTKHVSAKTYQKEVRLMSTIITKEDPKRFGYPMKRLLLLQMCLIKGKNSCHGTRTMAAHIS